MSEQQVTGMARIQPESQAMADLNAGFAFFLDCVVNLFVLAGILSGLFGMPDEIVFGKIIPGCIVGILVGNLLNVWYTNKRIKETGNEKLTSIPLGVDLPTILGFAFLVIGPIYGIGVAEGMESVAAAERAWHVAIAGTIWLGIAKFILSFFSRQMESKLPQMALVGAMAGVATVWLGANAILTVFTLPVIGLMSFAIMAYSLMGGHRLPFGLPGAVVAILLGTVIYYVFAALEMPGNYVFQEVPDLVPALPLPGVAGFTGMFGEVTGYMGIIIPFGLLIAASGVNVVAGAKVLGDDYDPRTTVQIDSVTTVIMGIFGGPAQTTPYFGHATYKRMGARTHYALGAASIIAVGGFLGVIGFASKLIPAGVLAPILVVVASDILRLCFTAGQANHAPGLLMAIIPAILNYAHTMVNELYGKVQGVAAETNMAIVSIVGSDWMAKFDLLGMLGRGYILTSLLWGSITVWILDGEFRKAAIGLVGSAVLAWFGVIHSALPSNGMYLPWNLEGAAGSMPDQFALAYILAALVLFGLSLTSGRRQA